jgi:radical SAM superfamily enzyme YgiQ (UPF0313 family)
MYGMDCRRCVNRTCFDCEKLDRSHKRLIALLRNIRAVPSVKRAFVRSGIRYDLANEAYIRELAGHHISDRLKIAPEHVSKKVLKLMNKDRGGLDRFIRMFKKAAPGKKLSFYFMTGHPGEGPKEARALAGMVGRLRNAEAFQLFTPTPGTVSTCMYHTEMDPRTLEAVYVAKSFTEKKRQKRLILNKIRPIGPLRSRTQKSTFSNKKE